MEEELKCPVCCRFYTNPVLLPCSHSMCLACAQSNQVPAQQLLPQSDDSSSAFSELDYPDIDKLSLLSETDSGVVLNSRPNSYVGTPSIGSFFYQSIQGNALGICCTVCKKNIYLDENGVSTLPKNRVLESIVDKYGEQKSLDTYCQLCEGDPRVATAMCEQCEIFYCTECRESCHPSRGPLAKHNLVPPVQGKALLRTLNKNRETKCQEHVDEHLSMYCMLCRTTVCYICVQDGRHINHDVQALGAMCKSQKVQDISLINTVKPQRCEHIETRKKSVYIRCSHVRGLFSM